MPVDFNNPLWRLEERTKRMMDRHGLTKDEAEALVKKVILEKEGGNNDTHSSRDSVQI
jgi:hypothetical protein